MKRLIFISLLLILSNIVFAQKPLINYIDESGKALKIDPSVYQQISLKAVGHDNKEHEYSGVLLSDILSAARISLDDTLKRQTVSRYIVFRAKDNYQCVFAFAEIDPVFTGNQIILADKMDGKDLGGGNGPFQVIVPSDKKHGRWIRQVVSIEVKTLK